MHGAFYLSQCIQKQDPDNVEDPGWESDEAGDDIIDLAASMHSIIK